MLLKGELQDLAGLCGHMKYSRKADFSDLKALGMERVVGGGGEHWGSGAARREGGKPAPQERGVPRCEGRARGELCLSLLPFW